MSHWFRAYGLADVMDNLLIGAVPLDQADVDLLGVLRIERIVNLIEDREYPTGARLVVERAYQTAGIEETRVPLADYGHLPAESLDELVALVGGSLGEGRRVYVHCRAGRQRSPVVAAATIAAAKGVDVDAALAEVARRRPAAEPLLHQRQDLRDWWERRRPPTAGPA